MYGATELVPDRRGDLLSSIGDSANGDGFAEDDGRVLRAVGDRGDQAGNCLTYALEHGVHRAVHTAARREFFSPFWYFGRIFE